MINKQNISFKFNKINTVFVKSSFKCLQNCPRTWDVWLILYRVCLSGDLTVRIYLFIYEANKGWGSLYFILCLHCFESCHNNSRAIGHAACQLSIFFFSVWSMDIWHVQCDDMSGVELSTESAGSAEEML